MKIKFLGFALTLSLIELAGGNLILLLITSAVLSGILGMGMLTVGVYILLATLITPSPIEMAGDVAIWVTLGLAAICILSEMAMSKRSV
ncbi:MULTISPECIES: hypothetical protein [Marivita]|uniref:Uncharacterized protein n=1 Tax=Marivita cryptomonadis TaxID=505252 RepID=A0A9Q2NTF1_9RHOB|nr:MULTISPECIES: hypothetical protein [Marivita]MCR9167364.1 hypothetical protein [Paracoccaceae bacterium]MBM2322483.1 hypothetical protein [Marivita cryptomonadis]MBM2332065.1 hypothetical protein [Marivita cryptomonadis]MBM2341649.1 hypothetical protein [Marivita cryptomonadis]MBM2346313.1 hypothetical protein [Marivita cryptomonadis]